jgi:hypothetical protein
MMDDYDASGTACADGSEPTQAQIDTFNKWLDSTKLTAPTTVPKLPGFLDLDLVALSAGTWNTVAAYVTAEAATAGTGLAACSAEYTLLRALWDEATIPAATLTAGGLAITHIPALLFEYELNADADIWNDFADYFVDGEEFADADFALSDLQDIFCADGVPADAADVVTNAADFSDAGLPFDQLFLDFFLDNVEGWDEGELTASATSSDYEWLNAICPGDGSGWAANVDLWGELLEDLVAYGDEGMFALVADCNPDFVEGTPSTTIAHIDSDVACAPCPVAGADGVVV